MKRALLLLIGLVATALTAHAQRLLPRQTGVEITAGVPVIQNEKLIQPETFTANISFTHYLKAENYTFLSAVYERQNLPYGKSNVPLCWPDTCSRCASVDAVNPSRQTLAFDFNILALAQLGQMRNRTFRRLPKLGNE